MWKKNMFKGIMMATIVGTALFASNVETQAQDATYRTFVGCTPLTTAQKNAALADFDNLMQEMGIPLTITDPYGRGTTHQVNKNSMLNDCMVVYGSAASIPSTTVYPGTKQKQTIGAGGNPIFIGFDMNRRLYPSSIESTNPADERYFNNRNFIKNPWTAGVKWPAASHTLASSISASSVKPVARPLTFATSNAVDGVTLTETQELARVNDFIYWQNSNRSRGKIGYLRAWNGNTGVTWSAAELYSYASVEYFPTEYSPGMFNIYTWAANDVYFYSTNTIPQHKMPFREQKPNVKIEITSLSSPQVREGATLTVNYRVSNIGTSKVVNPVISYYTQGKTAVNSTLSTTLNPGGFATGSFTVTIPTVSANKSERIFVEVNKNRKNPLDETTYADNIDSEYFGVINSTYGGTFKFLSHLPTYPRSNQNTTFNYEICNLGNTNMNNVQSYLNWPRQAKMNGDFFPLIRGEVVTYNATTKTFSKTNGECLTGSTLVPAADTAEIEKQTTMTGTTSNNLTGTRNVIIRNPNASLKIKNQKLGAATDEKEFGDLSVTVTNNMFRTVSQTCAASGGCKVSPESTTFNIKFYDVTNGTPIEVTAAAYNGTYSLAHGTQFKQQLTNSKTALMNYIAANGEKITTFKVIGYIPYYLGEYDVHGNPMYTDNKEEFEIQYFPPRPDVANASCDVIEHPVVNHFATSGGPSLVKACMGHFPNNPSTLVEKGMQSYNYVLYRFHPMPLPKYDIYSPELNNNNPNYFYQILNTVDDNRVLGDANSYIFKTQTGGVFKERGRYLPTSVDFEFEIRNETLNVSTVGGKVIAVGNASYTIPPSCYETDKLDLRYHYGCGEIMVFLPNTQANLLEIPAEYDATKVENRQIDYPINGTKIPYLNPGKYTFELKATESYQYYKQVNNNYDPGTYNWSNISAS